jgi:hypothetical protein
MLSDIDSWDLYDFPGEGKKGKTRIKYALTGSTYLKESVKKSPGRITTHRVEPIGNYCSWLNLPA